MDLGTNLSAIKLIFCPKSQAEPRGGLHYSFSECFGPLRAAHTGGGHPATPLGSPSAVRRQKEQLLPKAPTRLPIKWGGEEEVGAPWTCPSTWGDLRALPASPQEGSRHQWEQQEVYLRTMVQGCCPPTERRAEPTIPPSSLSKLQTLINNNKNLPYVKLIAP